MPSLSLYKNRFGNTGGEIRIDQSKKVIESTWWEDPSAKVAYLYDWYHDNYKTKLLDMNSPDDELKIPIDIKYIINSTQTFDKDTITYHIMFKPSQKCNVDYYNEKIYDSTFPCGLYIDIPDTNGVYNRWLVVNKANYYDTMFPTFDILPCDKIIQYIMDGKKINIAGVMRSQNSYNSGLWTDYLITSTQDQQKFILPLNRDTEKIYYNQRFIIDGNVLTEPRTWVVSKVNRTTPNGLLRATLSQTEFNPVTDYIEVDDDGIVVGMWADYYSRVSDLSPTVDDAEQPIQFSGIYPQVKVGGSYKKFTCEARGDWQFSIGDQDASDLINVIYDGENIAKVKWIGGDTYIGSVLTIKRGNSSLDVEIISL